MMNVQQAVGSFIGLAVGDALGATLEFGPRLHHNPHTEMIGKGPFGLKPGQYTDDTAMAIALSHGILNSGKVFNPFEAAMEFASWYARGKYSSNGRCFDIGNQTRKALDRFIDTKTAIASEDEEARGNGAMMRLAPVPIAYWQSPETAAHVADLQARITHNSQYNAAACRWLAYRLAKQFSSSRSLFHEIDGDGEELLAGNMELIACVRERWKVLPPSSVISDGHVMHTLGAALWSVQNTSTFEAAVVTAVNLGGDADTVGAVTGMIAGAVYGVDAIPERWSRVLVHRDPIKSLAQRLTQLN